MVPVNMGSDEESGGGDFAEDHDSAPLAEDHPAGISGAGSGSKKGGTVIGTSTRGKATNSISEGNTKVDKLSGINQTNVTGLKWPIKRTTLPTAPQSWMAVTVIAEMHPQVWNMPREVRVSSQNTHR